MNAVIRISIAIALVAAGSPALADESSDGVGVPVPERETTVETVTETTTEPEIVGTVPTALPSYVLQEEPISPVHRPKGFWGPLAIAADLLVMRPIGFVSLAAGGAAFVVVAPVAAATQTIGDRTEALQDRAKDVFTRPLGAL